MHERGENDSQSETDHPPREVGADDLDIRIAIAAAEKDDGEAEDAFHCCAPMAKVSAVALKASCALASTAARRACAS